MSDENTNDPWLRWWRGLSPRDRAVHRERQGQPFRLATVELREDVHGDPHSVEQVDTGDTGVYDLPRYLLDDPETDDDPATP